MSPSRIPRPGGDRVSSPPSSVIRSAPASSPAPAPASAFRGNNPSAGGGAATHNPNNPRIPSPTNTHNSPRIPCPYPTPAGQANGSGANRVPSAKRRVKPPSADPEDVAAGAVPVPGSCVRRPVPGMDGSNIPRPNPPRVPSGSPGHEGYQGNQGNQGHQGPQCYPGVPRSCLRQPSTPSLSSAERVIVGRPAQTDPQRPSGRQRAATSATQPPRCSPLLFEPSFANSREPGVPPHIRTRLRLIHQLGTVLGIDAQGISSKIDIPGLLARVDQAYEKGWGRDIESENGAISGLPLPFGSGGERAAEPIEPMPPLTPRESMEVLMDFNLRDKDARTRPEPGSGPCGGPTERGGMLGVLRRLGRRASPDDIATGFGFPGTAIDGPVFGVELNEAPPGSWCTSLIGGQRHELPLLIFSTVEEIYRRGMSQPGIFRLAGDGPRISHLTKVFNLPPLYGDSVCLDNEPIHNLTGLMKRYVRDLPEPILDESLFPAFVAFCAEPEPGALVLPLETRVAAAQILLKLLPPLHFSLLIYLIAFLGQLPLFPENRLNVDSISIIFGPAICAARGRGIAGLGPVTTGKRGVKHDPEQVSELVNQSQLTLAWLLRHWGAISENVLDTPFDEAAAAKAKKKKEEEANKVDPRLLSPIDLRAGQCTRLPYLSQSAAGSSESEWPQDSTSAPTATPTPTTALTSPAASMPTPTLIPSPTPTPSTIPPLTPPASVDVSRNSSTGSEASSRTAFSETNSNASLPMLSTASVSPSATPAPTGLPVSPSSSSIFARAFSSMNGSSHAADSGGGTGEATKLPKRSASFTSLSSLVKKGGVLIHRMEARGSHLPTSKTGAAGASPPVPKTKLMEVTHQTPAVNLQISSVLGSLHDLLVSKDKQIERDARELALLRHTLLEMDEKLQRALSPGSPLALSSTAVPQSSLARSPAYCSSHTLTSLSTSPHAPIPALPQSSVHGPAQPSARSSILPPAVSVPPSLTHAPAPAQPTQAPTPRPAPSPTPAPAPTITITSTPSITTLALATKERDLVDLQAQLRTALAALETARLGARRQAERVLVLEARLARWDSEKRLEVGKLEVALALEQARVVGLVEERDLARGRLDKVKTTLFSVA